MSEEESKDGAFHYFAVLLAGGFAAILLFSIALIALSFPAGVYAFFFTKLSANYTSASLGYPYLWIGPAFVEIPILMRIGIPFLAAISAYIALFAYTIVSGVNPVRAIRESFKKGFSSFFSSPFLVSVIAIGFLVFTASLVDTVVSGSAPPQDPLVELWGLTYAPLVEEFGFRVLMIGLVAGIVSLDKGFRAFLHALWRPSSTFGSDASMKLGVAALVIVSSLTFGYTHVLAGWTPGKFFEASYGGFVLAYLYVKYGFPMAVLGHWGIDYFGSVFSFYGQGAFGIPWNSLTQTYILQELVNIDLLTVLGLASFLVVLYLGVSRLVARPSEVHKAPSAGDPGES